jgi:hypothetical protein
MSWFRRNRGPSEEALKALADAKNMVDTTRKLRERADGVSAELEAHRQSNGFAEIVRGLYSSNGRK